MLPVNFQPESVLAAVEQQPARDPAPARRPPDALRQWRRLPPVRSRKVSPTSLTAWPIGGVSWQIFGISLPEFLHVG